EANSSARSLATRTITCSAISGDPRGSSSRSPSPSAEAPLRLAVAVRRAAVAEGLTGDRNEREVIAGRVERQLEDAIGAAVPDLGVGRDRREPDKRSTAGADHELSDPLGRRRAR